ncbi:MAG: hypothetical protein IH991_24955 [Planctomycetes bacterium]|nr:hypothetical protein [Planctomycetota bacterium]
MSEKSKVAVGPLPDFLKIVMDPFRSRGRLALAVVGEGVRRAGGVDLDQMVVLVPSVIGHRRGRVFGRAVAVGVVRVRRDAREIDRRGINARISKEL